MATKTDFTTEEWSEVLGSVMLAGMAVTLADPSGLIGMTKEGLASGSVDVDHAVEKSRLRDRNLEQAGRDIEGDDPLCGSPAFDPSRGDLCV